MTREVNEMTELLENNNLTLILNDAQSYIDSIPQRINDYANESIYDVIGPGGTFENIRGTIEEVLDGIKDNIGHLNYTLPLAEARNSVQDFTDNVDYWEVNFEEIFSNLTLTLVGGLCEKQEPVKSIFWETSLLNRLHIFLLLS